MKKMRFVILVMMICCLAGCAEPTAKSDAGQQDTDALQTYFMYDTAIEAPNGFYYADHNGMLYYFDYATEESILVCNKPNCSHERWTEYTPLEERCSAYVIGMAPGFVNGGKLYLMERVYGEKKTQIRIVESDLDRTNQREVIKMDCDSIYSFAVKNSTMYAIVDQVEMIEHEDGTATGGSRKKAMLCSIDLSNGQVQILMEKEDFSAVVTIMAAKENYLYLDYSYFQKPFDGTNYKEAGQQAEYYEYSIETGEVRQILKDFKEDQILKVSMANGCFYAKTAPMDRSMNEGKSCTCELVKIDLETEKVQTLAQMTEEGMLYGNYAIYEKEGETGGFIYDFEQEREIAAPRMDLVNFYPYYKAGEYIYGGLQKENMQEAAIVFIRLSDLMEGKDAFIPVGD